MFFIKLSINPMEIIKTKNKIVVIINSIHKLIIYSLQKIEICTAQYFCKQIDNLKKCFQKDFINKNNIWIEYYSF